MTSQKRRLRKGNFSNILGDDICKQKDSYVFFAAVASGRVCAQPLRLWSSLAA